MTDRTNPEEAAMNPDQQAQVAGVEDALVEDALVEDVSIDGMCGVY